MARPYLFAFFSVFGCALSGVAVAGTVIHVPADQATIQAGINAASNGDTVLVAPGTYKENINFNGKAITVESSNGAKVTIIDANKLGPAATFISGELTNSVLKGFTLTNGVGAGAPYYTNGGGVAIAYSSPTITQNTIINNTDGNGGGIGSSFGSPLITNNIIKNNTASLGAGVFIGGATVASFPAVVSNNTIEANTTVDYYCASEYTAPLRPDASFHKVWRICLMGLLGSGPKARACCVQNSGHESRMAKTHGMVLHILMGHSL